MPPEPVVIVPGFLLTPGRFEGTRAALSSLGVADARVVPVTLVDWAASVSAAGWARILDKIDRTVDRALEATGADKAVLVGHSAGGVMARLFLAPEPFRGRVYDGKRRVRGLITLGSPHQAVRASPMRMRVQRLYPGACFAPEVEYLAVAGKAVRGDRRGSRRERSSFRSYRMISGDGAVWGDGAVPVGSALLEGARHLVLDGVHHYGFSKGRRWYGSADAVASWWKKWGHNTHSPI
jgi:pimeloyl-ACP methyl ester carboxylesterase